MPGGCGTGRWMKTKRMLWSRINASAWRHHRCQILRMLFLRGSPAYASARAHVSVTGATAFCQGRLIRHGSVRLAVAHPPETVVERSGENTAIGVVPTHHAGGPAQALGIGK